VLRINRARQLLRGLLSTFLQTLLPRLQGSSHSFILRFTRMRQRFGLTFSRLPIRGLHRRFVIVIGLFHRSAIRLLAFLSRGCLFVARRASLCNDSRCDKRTQNDEYNKKFAFHLPATPYFYLP